MIGCDRYWEEKNSRFGGEGKRYVATFSLTSEQERELRGK